LAPLALPAPLQSFLGTLVVLLSALLLFVHRNQAKWAAPLVMTNLAAVRLGDLSYVWYLVHWPTILFIKYFFTIDSFSWKSEFSSSPPQLLN
jgi:peptidoglycan/LPS O-acetylase OafA/YrhL